MITYPVWKQDTIITLLLDAGLNPVDIVRLVEVGSTAHGINTSTSGDDLDLTAIRMEPFFELISGHASWLHDAQSMQLRTRAEGHRSMPDDIDLNVYTLRRFAALARKGNPSILTAIFSEKVAVQNLYINFDELADLCKSTVAGGAFLGYMGQQIQRWTGVRGQKSVKRPELVEAYGYDTKYAAHVIRLGFQGISYMRTGRFSVPMPEMQADTIRSIRNGEIDETAALDLATNVEGQLRQAIAESALPQNVDKSVVDAWVVEHYRRWRERTNR